MSEIKGYFLEDLSVGMSETVAKTVSAEDIDTFADVTGDHNPIHLDQAYAETTFFKDRIAHGMLTASFISAVLGTRLPGPGCVYLSQSLKFRAPVKIGDEVITRVTVAQVDGEKRRIRLETTCSVGETVVIEGEALLMVQRRPQLTATA